MLQECTVGSPDRLYFPVTPKQTSEHQQTQEGHSCERFGELYSHVPRVRTPAILWEATGRRVLTMEWIDGVKLTDKPKMDAAGLNIVDFVNVRTCPTLTLGSHLCL